MPALFQPPPALRHRVSQYDRPGQIPWPRRGQSGPNRRLLLFPSSWFLGNVVGTDHAVHGHAFERDFLLLFKTDAEGLGLGLDDAIDTLPLDYAGLDGIDADIVRAGFHRQALGVADYAPFRRGIRRAERESQAPRR